MGLIGVLVIGVVVTCRILQRLRTDGAYLQRTSSTTPDDRGRIVELYVLLNS